ncbi:MAG: exodeoxyribonuclease VII large subunit [Lachnospiraceae bacterium]|nr:exodeoxyribonuclease VII large subunit [Lachnospiraceae bacterium]
MKAYTVSQVNGYIKNMFVKDMLLGRISIKGEVSNCKYHTSGHIYFTLKDGMSQLPCVMFAGQRAGLAFRMEEGQSVIASGSVNVYERDGRYQLYASEIVLDGVGQLYERFEQLKAKLLQEGLFDVAHKKPIPPYPKRIGVVTARTGAALQDMINITHRRNPYVQLILCPAQVQGFGAAETIVRGIKRLDALGVDIIIVGRGGGSIEDLWAFNEECVARAVYDCRTPVISAVGHETDTTMIDFVSDLRAPTPSAAAELAVYEIQNVLSSLAGYHSELTRSMLERLEELRAECDGRKLRLSYLSPRYRLNEKRAQAADCEEKLKRRMKELFAIEHQHIEKKRQLLAKDEERLRRDMKELLLQKRHGLALRISRLEGLSPLGKLNQGYSYVADKDGRNISTIQNVRKGDELTISVRDGNILAQVTKTESRRKTDGTA